MSKTELSPAAYFRKQKLITGSIFALLLVMTIASTTLTRFNVSRAFTSIPTVIGWMFTNLVPSTESLVRLPDILEKLVATIFMSIMSSMTGAVFAFPFAILGSKTTAPNSKVAVLPRIVASLFRNIPVAVWALIFLFSFGSNDFTGFLALFLATFGFLTRAFMETIDEASASSVEALRASGSTYGQIIAQAVIPGSLPQMISWVLYMIETNIRSATLVGLLTGTGIGFLFDLYYKSLQYDRASLVVLSIVVVVLAIELLSNGLRRVIL